MKKRLKKKTSSESKAGLLEDVWSLANTLYTLWDEGYLDENLRLKVSKIDLDEDELGPVTGREVDDLRVAARKFRAAFGNP